MSVQWHFQIPRMSRTVGLQLGLLLLWVGVGVTLRFTQLAEKPPWTDEFATLVFSLGHSFETVPLNQIISLDTLMQPLQLPQAGAEAVVRHLFAEDVHPPLYFVLSNVWLRLFSADTGLVSLWLTRSLPALLGTASIPAMFGLSWLLLRSPLASHLTAAMMAVSPYGIYLAQEARHYTFGILWVIASLSCLVIALRKMQCREPVSMGLGCLWVVINGLGIAAHYFFMLSLGAMAIALLDLAIRQARQNYKALFSRAWQSIYAVGLGTAIVGSIWLPTLQGIRNREITQWIQNDQPFGWLDLINPIFQSIAAWATMLVLLPIEADNLAVAIATGVIMVGFILWIAPQLWQGLKQQWVHPQTGQTVRGIVMVLLGAIALFWLISYGLRTDLTRGARYSFVYFPAVILLLGSSLAALWHKRGVGQVGRLAVVGVLLFGLLSALTVVHNLGYRKYYRPDLLISIIGGRSQNPAVVATTQNTLVQMGEVMGIGWQYLQAERRLSQPQFLLAQEQQNPCKAGCQATATLQQALAQIATPIDLWLVNFHAPAQLNERCQLDSQPKPYVSGYEYQLYRCVSR